MKIIKRSGLLIPKEYSDREFYRRIKENLERRTRSYNRSDSVVNIFYLESEKFLLIPRNFPLQSYVFDYNIEDHTHEGTDININHHIIPRSDAQLKAIDFMMNTTGGIIELSPGVGKTVITIYMIAERKKRSIILVHKDALAEQWKERFLQFTDISQNEIVRLSSATFRDDLQKSIIIITAQTFLSLLKRNRKDFLIELNNANIGVFVGDEIHTSIGAPTFSECSIHIPSKYTFGLSATPERYDGNSDILEYHLGPIFSDDDASGTMDTRVTVLLTDYQIDTPTRSRYIRWGGEFQRSRYLNQMAKSKPFLEAVKGFLTTMKSKYKIICMVERVKLIDELYDWLQHPSKSKFYKSEKMDVLSEDVTFTTPGKCRDGVDAPWKDCLILTSPISNIKQAVGRVVRDHKGKQTPIIIDMVDLGCEEIRRTFHKRRAYYKEKEWPIQYLVYVNGKLAQIDEYVANELMEGKQ